MKEKLWNIVIVVSTGMRFAHYVQEYLKKNPKNKNSKHRKEVEMLFSLFLEGVKKWGKSTQKEQLITLLEDTKKHILFLIQLSSAPPPPNTPLKSPPSLRDRFVSIFPEEKWWVRFLLEKDLGRKCCFLKRWSLYLKLPHHQTRSNPKNFLKNSHRK